MYKAKYKTKKDKIRATTPRGIESQNNVLAVFVLAAANARSPLVLASRAKAEKTIPATPRGMQNRIAAKIFGIR